MAGIATAIAATQLAYGLYKDVKGAQNQSDAQKAMEAQAKNSPLWKPDKSVNDYYQESLNRFLENPTQSAQYQLAQLNANTAAAQGINAFQNRRSAIGGIDNIGQGLNTALQNAGAGAEAQRNARFGQLGGATQMMNAENQFGFDVNKMTPYNRQFGLSQLQASAGGQMANAGMQTAANALNNIGSIYSANAKTQGQQNYLKQLQLLQKIQPGQPGQAPASTFDSFPMSDSINPNIIDVSNSLG